MVRISRWILLNDFLHAIYAELLNSVHILPFFPLYSDDGFCGVRFPRGEPATAATGLHNRIAAISRLMVDLVLEPRLKSGNCQTAYRQGSAPFDTSFFEASPAE